MDRESLKKLEKLNQLQLTEEEASDVLAFFDEQEKGMELLNSVDTEKTERMVHVMPMQNVVRPDVAVKTFTREDLQRSAPETKDGYWQVPRLVE